MNRHSNCHTRDKHVKLLLTAFAFASIAAAAEPPPPAVQPPAVSTSSAGVGAGAMGAPQAPNAFAPSQTPSNLTVTINKSIILEHPAGIRRVSITNPDIAEAVAVSSVELLVNGKSAGDTSLILWDQKGARSNFDIHVLANSSKLDLVRNELLREVGPAVSLTLEDNSVFLRGTVSDPVMADRAASIAGTLGKVVNLLRVLVPPEEPQVLLKVRFADVDRSATSQLGVNLFSANQKGVANSSTTQFGQYPNVSLANQGFGVTGASATFSDLLNIFYFNPDLNIGAFIQALEAKALLQILAEPNLLTVSGRPASFLAGGEFPFPTIQGGASGVGQITIQFKEFGIRLNFVPTVTPRGTIHLVVSPEVSSLDYSNGLTVNGFTVPGLDTRRVQTEIELESGQSFVIAGLLNNQVTEQLNKVPGLANIPVLGKLFQSRSLSKSNSELLILVTPELVRPIPAGAKRPDVDRPVPFLKGTPASPPSNPDAQVTGPAQPIPRFGSLPVEELKNPSQASGPAGNANSNSPMPAVPPAESAPAGTQPNAAAANAGANPPSNQTSNQTSNH